jgi:hypothetical protein
MTTRDELRAMIDRVPDEVLDALAENMKAFIGPRPPWPKSLAAGLGPADLGRNADRYLAEGFGE